MTTKRKWNIGAIVAGIILIALSAVAQATMLFPDERWLPILATILGGILAAMGEPRTPSSGRPGTSASVLAVLAFGCVLCGACGGSYSVRAADVVVDAGAVAEPLPGTVGLRVTAVGTLEVYRVDNPDAVVWSGTIREDLHVYRDDDATTVTQCLAVESIGVTIPIYCPDEPMARVPHDD